MELGTILGTAEKNYGITDAPDPDHLPDVGIEVIFTPKSLMPSTSVNGLRSYATVYAVTDENGDLRLADDPTSPVMLWPGWWYVKSPNLGLNTQFVLDPGQDLSLKRIEQLVFAPPGAVDILAVPGGAQAGQTLVYDDVTGALKWAAIPAGTPGPAGTQTQLIAVTNPSLPAPSPAPAVGTTIGYLVTGTGTLYSVPVVAGPAVCVWNGTAWEVYQPGAAAVQDTTAPTAGTMSVTPAYTSAVYSITGAMDETALNANPYSIRYATDSGMTTAGAWSAWSAASSGTITGLTQGTSYYWQHRVQDAAGNIKLGAIIAAKTDAQPVWSTLATDDFSTGRTDGAKLVGTTTATGSLVWGTDSSGYTTTVGTNAWVTTGGVASLTGGGAQQFIELKAPASTTTKGISITFDYVLPSAASMNIYVSSNAAASNYGGFQISAAGVVGKLDYGTTSTISGTGTAAAKSGTIAATWSVVNGAVTATLVQGGVTLGTITYSAITWQAQPVILIGVASNGVTSTLDNAVLKGAL